MLNRSMDGNPGVETILKKFQLKAQDLIDLKEHILAAIVMRNVFDGILNRPLSILLKEDEEGLLTSIYESMATMNPPKGNLPHSSCVDDNANDTLVSRSAHDAHLEK
jgi:thiamine phosphate synthase YjbQ (UPF0047 family)